MTEPATTAQLLEQGLFHHRQGDIALAMDRYTEVLRNDPNNTDALYYVAVVACHEGQFQQGIELARRSLTFRPRQARAHNVIGQAFHRLGQIKDALASFDDALECDPKFTDAYGNRANMLSELGRPAEALSSFDRAFRSIRTRARTGSTAAPRCTVWAASTRRSPATTAPSRSMRNLPCRISIAPRR
jgi:tetratricopeptide (TPR) repeat protein